MSGQLSYRIFWLIHGQQEPFFFVKPAKIKEGGGIALCISLASDWLKPKLIGSKN